MTVAFVCVLIAFLMPYAFTGIAKWSADFDNARPREYLARQTGYRQRAHWVQLNSFEMFPGFAAGVLIGHLAGASQATLDLWAVLYVGLRLAYGAAYLADRPSLRSIAWIGALICVIGLFIAGASGR